MTSAPAVRVLYLIWEGTLRGAERHVFDLASSLPRDRFAPMICFFAQAHGYSRLLAAADVPFVELGCTSTKLDIRAACRFRRVLSDEDVRIVHDHGAPLWARAVAKLPPKRIPVVYTEHLTTATPLRRRIYPMLRRLTDAHIAVSAAAGAMLVSTLGVPRSEVIVIANSVDPGRVVALAASEVAAVRREFGVAGDDELLLAVARLDPGKRIDRMITLISPILARRPRTWLLVAGEGGERGRLQQQIEGTVAGSRIRLLGERSDVPRLLAAADVMLSLSERESFGLAVAEAMLAGKPVVAARVPGVSEIVIAGWTGVLVDDAHLEAEFAAAVVALLDDRAARERLGKRGRERVLSEFSPTRMVDATAQVYERLLRAVA